MGILMTYSNCVNNSTVMQLRILFNYLKSDFEAKQKFRKQYYSIFLRGDWLNKYDLLKQY